MPAELTNIPKSRLADKIDSFRREGAVKVEVTFNGQSYNLKAFYAVSND